MHAPITHAPVAPLIDCRIEAQPLDMPALRRDLPALPECGGYVAFEGHVRSVNNGKQVIRLDYEVYTSLALKELERIALQAAERFQLHYIRCVHRSGSLTVGDPAVLVQVLTRHRGEAFAGCRFLIDQLKSRVPIWKKEYYHDGSVDWTQCHDHVGHGPHHGQELEASF